jgi:hypothetical protein
MCLGIISGIRPRIIYKVTGRSVYCYGDQINENETDGMCRTHEVGRKKCIPNFVRTLSSLFNGGNELTKEKIKMLYLITLWSFNAKLIASQGSKC